MTTFNRNWLTNPQFYGWLENVPSDARAAYCKLCCKKISLSNMGKAAIMSHMQSKKHMTTNVQEKNVTLTSLFKNQEMCSMPSTSCASTSDTAIAESVIHFGEKTEIQVCDVNHNLLDKGDFCVPPPRVDDHVATPQVKPIDKYLQMKETKKVEILWALKCVTDHYSFTSNNDMAQLFRKMFPDSHIA